jgi:hypothetical protein
MGDWVITTAPTTNSAGSETRTCTNAGCNHFETRAIPRLPAPPTLAPPTTAPPTPAQEVCPRCDREDCRCPRITRLAVVEICEVCGAETLVRVTRLYQACADTGEWSVTERRAAKRNVGGELRETCAGSLRWSGR